MGGIALLGRVWVGDGRVFDPGVVLINRHGEVDAIGPAAEGLLGDRAVGAAAGARAGSGVVELPGLRLLRGAWIGPALVDRHVHLAFGDDRGMVAGGVAGVRDLGAPLDRAVAWRRRSPVPGGGGAGIVVQIAGPVLTAPGGYPCNGWGADGFTLPVATVEQATAAVSRLADADVDVVKLALEPAGGQPVPSSAVAAAVVRASHDAGIPVVAHALTAAMVTRALDAGVDELAHVPVEKLPPRPVHRIAAAGVRVVSTIESLRGYTRSAVVANAAALVSAGVPLVYGTDLGNARTRPGADPRELEHLAAAGLGRAGALRAATRPLTPGTPAALVVLDRDPLLDPTAWLSPLAVVAGTTAIEPGTAAEGAGAS